VKLEREAKQSSEMVDRRENEASSNQMKADGREIDRTSGPFRAGFQKNLANQTSSLKTSLSRSALILSNLIHFCGPLEKSILS
tara:strand:+ start:572 stop:820 length:249 start_codon:yes stop_codon:yes gene_type:complete